MAARDSPARLRSKHKISSSPIIVDINNAPWLDELHEQVVAQSLPAHGQLQHAQDAHDPFGAVVALAVTPNSVYSKLTSAETHQDARTSTAPPSATEHPASTLDRSDTFRTALQTRKEIEAIGEHSFFKPTHANSRSAVKRPSIEESMRTLIDYWRAEALQLTDTIQPTAGEHMIDIDTLPVLPAPPTDTASASATQPGRRLDATGPVVRSTMF